MSATAFAAKGSAGAAANTIWFGSVPDRLNMLAAMQIGGGANLFPANVTPAHYANLWSLSGVTLGSFTTAPDGTTNSAQAITEDSSTGLHQLLAATYSFGANSPSGALRVAGFFKNNGRRVGLQVTEVTTSDGVYAVFDLAGGQVGVTGTVLGSSSFSEVLDTQIIPAGGGFYLCVLDFAKTFHSFAFLNVSIFLDNGTGTAALSNSYTGGGTAGVYGWRTNMCPVCAYAINNNVFFDDFNTLSTIDVNNTQVTGFNWYVENNFSNAQINWDGLTLSTAQPSWFSIPSPSILQIDGQKQNLNAVTIASACEPGAPTAVGAPAFGSGPGVYVGTQFYNGTPTLWEFRKSQMQGVRTGGYIDSVYTFDSTWGASNAQGPSFNASKIWNAREVDFTETLYSSHGDPCPHLNFGGFNSRSSNFTFLDPSPTFGTANNIRYGGGTMLYQSPQYYGQGITAVNGNNGVRYIAAGVGGNFPGDGPPPNADWTQSDYPGTGTPNYPPITFNLASLQNYSYIIQPFYGSATPSDSQAAKPHATGLAMIFVNGLMVSAAAWWTPYRLPSGTGSGAPDGSTQSHTTDGHYSILFIGADTVNSTTPGPGVPTQFDYVRVMQ